MDFRGRLSWQGVDSHPINPSNALSCDFDWMSLTALAPIGSEFMSTTSCVPRVKVAQALRDKDKIMMAILRFKILAPKSYSLRLDAL